MNSAASLANLLKAGCAILGLAVLAGLPVLASAQETPAPTPTIDRLAAPPTVAAPTQADDGAQLFWLYCQPCHGDQGQGLTDEWRAQYPPEHQNCWGRGCHGNVPYLGGFILPKQVPAVIGGDSLAKFEHMGQVYQFVRTAMPLEAPGRLADEEYLAIIAFLARSHDVWDGRPLTADGAARLRLKPLPQPTPAPVAQGSGRLNSYISGPAGLIGGVTLLAVVLAATAGGIWLWLRQRP